VSRADIRFRRLLDRGFYPQELPPTFRTKNFGTSGSALLAINGLNSGYSGSTIFLDGSNFQGNHRTFGVINPVNYCLLSRHIADEWSEIAKFMRKSRSSLFQLKFPNSISEGGRSFEKVTFSSKLKHQQYLSSSYPVVLCLDINRFYGSIYTHSIPWAALGKAQAKARLSGPRQPQHWSEKLDRLAQYCNDRQTIGIPIGPDTSRIISEVILTGIDTDLTKSGSGISTTQFVHSIDDYEFGITYNNQLDIISVKFERSIRQFELRSNEYKKRVEDGRTAGMELWQHRFDYVSKLEGNSFIEALFSLIWEEKKRTPDANVVGYALRRFRKKIAHQLDRGQVLRHLQRLAFAAPHLISWIAPFFVGFKAGDDLDSAQKRLIRWSASESARRHDIVTLLWFLYLHLHFDLRIEMQLFRDCFDIDNPLVDLVLSHAKHNNLVQGAFSHMVSRYDSVKLNSASWIFLYEVERKSWNHSYKNGKIGTSYDDFGAYDTLRNGNVEFYDPSQFGLLSFNTDLTDADFDGHWQHEHEQRDHDWSDYDEDDEDWGGYI